MTTAKSLIKNPYSNLKIKEENKMTELEYNKMKNELVNKLITNQISRMEFEIQLEIFKSNLDKETK